ncbi:MAG: hypothetical protein OSB66_08185 [SAR202 cluster bacterium]|nr:hypothetical protein [SAR202 cluster bacterium]
MPSLARSWESLGHTASASGRRGRRVGPESRDGKAADVRSGQKVHAEAPRQP